MPLQCSADLCEQPVLEDCWFCAEHLRSIVGVYVAPSKTGYGKGLFTARSFKRGQRIAHYGGEVVSEEEMQSRYGWMFNKTADGYVVVTAPYALGIEGTTNSRDAARIRGAGSYCNSPKGLEGIRPNASLGNRYVRALVDMGPDTEVFVSYGRDYWVCASSHFETHSTTVQVNKLSLEPSCKKRKVIDEP
jgi:hypothetical protein